jgi:hypothetical protein
MLNHALKIPGADNVANHTIGFRIGAIGTIQYHLPDVIEGIVQNIIE